MISTSEYTSKQKNRIRLAVSLFYFSQGLAFSSWASRIPTIKQNLGISEGQLGTLLLLMPIGQLCTMALSGKLVAKYGSKNVLKIVVLIYPLVLCCIGLAQDFYQLATVLFFFGVIGNMCNISVNTQGVEVEKVYGKSIMSSFHGAWSIAGFTGALIGLLMMNLHINTFYHFVIIYVLIVINWFVNNKFLVASTTVQSKEKKSIFSKPDPTLIQLGVIGFLSMATEGAMFDWSGVYFQDIVKAPTNLVVVGYASFMIMMATGRFVGDYFVGKYGKQRVMQFSGLLMFSGLMLSVFVPQFMICTLAFMMVGLGVACNVPIVYSVAGKNKNVNPGVALAMVSSISFLGFLMGPPLIGYIAEAFDLRYSYALFACFGLIMLLMVGRMKIFKD
ncbi:Predicted arabinose efflux permease, MFS family [Algoriella xinjiangensis]|uniref:Predicted arabinose efflux permease, MFS family n=1 Tax=Algoriella xinjiangensis TaxID=684065 RepID=A0A1I4Z374_9FLAO|nr:MFS transporter [Algoriella xinjiangensis]SFN44429.1 Predicted arabinose efflux permease, MFS family [Algoriella xinjiangensis]VDH16602.1 Inner membrane protein ybjJ [Algoriella xinjiangensis]